MNAPGTTHHDLCGAPESAAPDFCELCNNRSTIDCDAFPPTGIWICVQCVEATLDAHPYESRSEMGLVGAGGCR